MAGRRGGHTGGVWQPLAIKRPGQASLWLLFSMLNTPSLHQQFSLFIAVVSRLALENTVEFVVPA